MSRITALYELLGTAQAEKPGWVALYRAGLAASRARNFAASIGLFQRLLALRTRDVPTQIMIERCRKFLEFPPSPELGRNVRDGSQIRESTR